MAAMRPLHPIPAVDCQGYLLEAWEAGRTGGGLQASVRAVDPAAPPGTRPLASDVVRLADSRERTAFAGQLLRALDPTTPGAPSGTDIEAALQDLHEAVEAKVREMESPSGRDAGGRLGGGLYDVEVPPSGAPGGHFVWFRPGPGGVARVPLCNFTAVITEERVLDDGAEQRIELLLDGQLENGRPLRPARVPATRFGAMSWVTEHWGTHPVVYAGAALKDHLRTAIQLHSMADGPVPRRVIFAHSGWRLVDGEGWVYLHGGGGIGKDGALPAGRVEVDLRGGLRHLRLPDPPAPDSPVLVQAIRASLALLDLAPDRVMVPILAAAYRAPLSELAPADVSVFVIGPTGQFKTEATALAQQHFGPGFDRKHLPAEWTGTANAIERILFEGKDSLVVVDDYAPSGSLLSVQKLHDTVGRTLRAIGNQSARVRMAADTTLRPSYPPRGLLLSSGEDVPASSTGSVVARLLAVEVQPGDVDAAALTVAQDRARSGWYAQAMAAYLQWLALRLDDERDLLADAFAALRARAGSSGLHRRTPEATATLALGWQWFLRFALERGGVTAAEHDALWARVWAALGEVAQAQQAAQQDQNPVTRFVESLASALASGAAHVAGPGGRHPESPDDPRRWGWRSREVEGITKTRTEWTPFGQRIGWVDQDDLYLEPGASYTMAETQARRTGGSLGVQEVTLRKRLHEAGALASVEEYDGKRYLTIRHELEGRRRRVLHVRAALLGEEVGQVGHVGHDTVGSAPPQEESPAAGAAVANNRGQQNGAAAPELAPKVGHDGRPSQGGAGRNGQLGHLGQLLPPHTATASMEAPTATNGHVLRLWDLPPA